jgi:hypothetical protein
MYILIDTLLLKPEGSPPQSTVLAIGAEPEPVQSNTQYTTMFLLKVNSNVILVYIFQVIVFHISAYIFNYLYIFFTVWSGHWPKWHRGGVSPSTFFPCHFSFHRLLHSH